MVNETQLGGNSGAELRAIVERIEGIEAAKAECAAELKCEYDSAKRAGFTTKIIRRIIRDRKRDADELAEEEALVAAYKTALGEFVNSPLGEAAIRRVS